MTPGLVQPSVFAHWSTSVPAGLKRTPTKANLTPTRNPPEMLLHREGINPKGWTVPVQTADGKTCDAEACDTLDHAAEFTAGIVDLGDKLIDATAYKFDFLPH